MGTLHQLPSKLVQVASTDIESYTFAVAEWARYFLGEALYMAYNVDCAISYPSEEVIKVHMEQKHLARDVAKDVADQCVRHLLNRISEACSRIDRIKVDR